MLLDPDGRTETILTLTLDGFLFFSPSLPCFNFFFPLLQSGPRLLQPDGDCRDD